MARVGGPSPAEREYGSGERWAPPMWSELSSRSQGAISKGFTASMSNWQTRENEFAARGNKGQLPEATRAALVNKTVGIERAATNVAGAWERMMSKPLEAQPAPSWYFGHNRRFGRAAETYDQDKVKMIEAGAGMSPQNHPDAEFKAASAMADAIHNKRMVNITDPETGVTQSRRLTSMTPGEMKATTAAENKKNVSSAADFDLAGFRSAGTNRVGGWRSMTEEGYSAIRETESGKVPFYAKATVESEPDTPLHHEYEMRYGDQLRARRAREKRQTAAEAGVTGPEALHSAMDRVDLYGLMKGGSDPTDPAYKHPILGTEGIAVPDSWMDAILSGQPMKDLPTTSSPAKMAASQTSTTSPPMGEHSFFRPKEAEEAGGKPLTPNTAHSIGAVRAIQRGAQKAREPESQTNIPPVMLQEMTWVSERQDVAESTKALLAAGEQSSTKGTAKARVTRLESGTLEGEKEFRPAEGSTPRPETPGTFFRGYDNPLDTDSVTIRRRPSS